MNAAKPFRAVDDPGRSAASESTIPARRRGPLRRRPRFARRRGAVTVEFAFVAPVMVVVLLGVMEASRALEIQTQLASAAREGARVAAMDRTKFAEQGVTANERLIADVRNLLTANGIVPNDPDDLTIEVLDFESPSETFDLEDPDNDYRLFTVLIRLPYGACTTFNFPGAEGFVFEASVTFRNARSTMVN